MLSPKIIIKRWNSLPQDAVDATYKCGLQKAIHCGGKSNTDQSVFYTKIHNISLQLRKHYGVMWDDIKGSYPLV